MCIRDRYKNLEVGGHSCWVRTPKNVALGYDVGKTSAGCLVIWFLFGCSFEFLFIPVLFSLQINDVAYIVFVFVDDNNNGVSEMRNCGRIAVTHSLKSITAGQHCVVNAVDGMLTRTDRGRYDKLFGCATLVWQKK